MQMVVCDMNGILYDFKRACVLVGDQSEVS